MRALLFLFALACSGSSAWAQGRRGADRYTWLSVSGGFTAMSDIDDGATAATWRFGDGFPIRVTVEREIDYGMSVGLQFSYARMPLIHQAWNTNQLTDAHATVATYGPVLRLGRGGGWYQVLEVFAGAMQFGNFTADAGGARLPPSRANVDFAFSLGTGIGVRLARDWAVELTGSYIDSIHDRTNLPNDAQTLRQHMMLMAGVRMGL